MTQVVFQLDPEYLPEILADRSSTIIRKQTEDGPIHFKSYVIIDFDDNKPKEVSLPEGPKGSNREHIPQASFKEKVGSQRGGSQIMGSQRRSATKIDAPVDFEKESYLAAKSQSKVQNPEEQGHNSRISKPEITEEEKSQLRAALDAQPSVVQQQEAKKIFGELQDTKMLTPIQDKAYFKNHASSLFSFFGSRGKQTTTTARSFPLIHPAQNKNSHNSLN